ncbi:transposase [Actinocrinis puniceicyclus]|uniref:Transposase n=1 Tax=Actinocrinis puniceicyclus TaxID=977794 RepID=A0A8J7WLE4_9ACTN|nr:DDE-type integrase/transposase/recombinase [Actinocrinis puniceicyclus]MBS2963438.1 transposase [Actinocrinis puniceicyclus]
MTGGSVTVMVGSTVLLDGDAARVVEFDGRSVTVQLARGRYRSVALAQFAARVRSLDPAVGAGVDPGLVLAGCSAEELARVREIAGHVREVLTGFASGHSGEAAPGEPRPAYAPGVSLTARYAAKAAELSVTARTVERWAGLYRECGEAGLVDERVRRGRGSNVDPRWEAAVRAEFAAGVAASTPTRGALLTRVTSRLEREYGTGVVPIPSRATAYRRLAELAKGTNAVAGSAKDRRSIAQRPGGAYGRLRATRPGEYVVLDTQDLDVYAMEPVTCRWVKAQLTVAQDLFDRRIVGLRVTPVSTKAVDVAGVLFEAVSGDPGRRTGLAVVGAVPDRLVFTEAEAPDASVWCPPATLVVDHGKAFLSAHVIGVCARLGISIQPANPYKPTDKPTVERFFKTLREGLIQHLPAYKGPDVHSRGEAVQEQAFLFLHELEDVVRDWIATVYHCGKHDGLVVADWPGLALSPNEMFEVGLAKAGRLRLPADPDLVFEFLPVYWRTVQHYGVEVAGLRYNGAALNGYRNAASPYGGAAGGRWPIRRNEDDVRFAYFRDPDDGRWHRLEWEHAALLGSAFSAEAARYARGLAAREDRFADPVEALAAVLERWSVGQVEGRRERRMAARLAAERAALPGLEAARDQEDAPEPAIDSERAPLPLACGDDDVEDEVVDDVAGFYADALEVLE